jgi:hypothetical protein
MLLDRRQRVATHHRQQGGIVPAGLGNKVVQGLMRSPDPERSDPGRHRLDALALARQQQTGGIGPQRLAPIRVAEYVPQALSVGPEPLLPPRHPHPLARPPHATHQHRAKLVTR